MPNPYWGQLPSPNKARRMPDSYNQSDRGHLSLSQPPYSSTRAFAQATGTTTDASTEVTYSPPALPTTSIAPRDDLASRSSSLSYSKNECSPLFSENRSTQTNRDQGEEIYDSGNISPPPAAPDVPKAPPISYIHPYRNSDSSYTYNYHTQTVSPRVSGRLETSEGAGMSSEAFYRDVSPAERRSRESAVDWADQDLDDDLVSPQYVERELVRSGSIRRPPNKYHSDMFDPASSMYGESLGPEPQQKTWAADRSPLQKLELTLGGITKEEKRARVEAAERRLREKAAQVQIGKSARPLPEPPVGRAARLGGDGQLADVETSRLAVVTEPIVADPIEAVPSAATAYGAWQQYDYPEQTPRSQMPAPSSRSVSTTNSGVPQRNLSFRERAATHVREYSQEVGGHSPKIGQKSASSGNLSPARTGSNKLKKNPPPGLMYNVRREAEERYMDRAETYNRRNLIDTSKDAETRPVYQNGKHATAHPTGKMLDNTSLPIEDMPRPPARGKTFGYEQDDGEQPSRMRGLAASIGFGRSNSMGANPRPSLPNTNNNAPFITEQYSQHDDLDRSLHRRETLSGPIKPIRTGSINQNRLPPAPGKAFQKTQPSDRGTKSVKFQDWQHEPGASDDNMSETIQHRHRLREYLHRDGVKPGQIIYRAPAYLDEWRQGAVGMLSASFLDLGRNPAQPTANSRRRPSFSSQPPKGGIVGGNDVNQTRTAFNPRLYLKCGPLLRYCGIHYEPTEIMDDDGSPLEKEIWRGSVMIVTQDSGSSYDTVPTLRLFVQPIELLPPPPAELPGGQPLLPEYVDPIAGIPKIGPRGETLYVRPVDHLEEATDLSMTEPDDGLFELTRTKSDNDANAPDPPSSFTSRKRRIEVDGEKLGKYIDVRGVRLHTERGHTFWRFNIAVELGDEQQRIAYRINRGPATGFWVPARGESMNIMFHTCNGFSQSVNPNDFSGPDPMWRDVLNNHQTRPFHVMIGGGDQVYNDAVVNKAKIFREWIDIKNPLHKMNAPFTAEMQDELETFYFERYMVWFSQGLFSLANSQIPMVNMYDDHDIIDGFGSYPDQFMKSPVFSGLGNVAFKYYLLFQHQSVPDETDETEPSWCLGEKPGPYIKQPNRSLFVSLGKRVALLAVDTRTERTRDEVVDPETWSKLLDRCYDSIVKGRTHHLLVLLGVPIAYPRLVWLENILNSKLMDPVKALTKFGMLGNFINKFDGGVEVLDDLGDHWTAKNHKEERKLVIEDLQDLAVDKCLRVTILSGDVHLAAVGQFYSNPKLRIPKHKDYRYMSNIISSAIANTPPPDLMADVLNKRNKVHHFDKETDENMVPLFAHGVDAKPRSNKRLLPHRNWCSIREYAQGQTPPPTPPLEDIEPTPEATPQSSRGGLLRRLSFSSKDRGPALRPDAAKEPTDRSRPPVSGGFMRNFSRRGSSSDDLGRPASGGLKRTLSLGSRPRNPFRRDSSKQRADSDGMNDSWGEESVGSTFAVSTARDSHPGSASIGLRGGAGSEYEIGDEARFTSRPPRRAYTQPISVGNSPHQGFAGEGGAWPNLDRPLHRTPTDIDAKKLAKHGIQHYEVNTEGGLDICLNVEVNPKDPAGITVPYRLFVPRLWYDYEAEELKQGEGTEAGMESAVSG
ncbi:hypothetical protein GGS21DRAFT_436363 [Xylaria nigripes]|nr:hypothetical protein GGS21DRAFT_436363 [Xylaria nigripes]